MAGLQVNLTHRVAGKVGGAEAKCEMRNATILGASEVCAGKELGIGDCVSGMKLLARGLELGALGG